MKRLIIFLLLFAAIKVAGQTTGYLRFDTVKIMKQNGTCELYIINKTKDSLGLLTNIGGGLTQFRRSRMLNDSTFVVGLDTLTVRGTGGSSGASDTTYTQKPINVLTGAKDTLALIYEGGLGINGDSALIVKFTPTTVPDARGSQVNYFGNSITQYLTAAPVDSAYPVLIADTLNAYFQNYALSGMGVFYSCQKHDSLIYGPFNNAITSVMVGYNDLRGTSIGNEWRTEKKIASGIKSMILNHFANEYISASTTGTDSTVTRSGTWTTAQDAMMWSGKTKNAAYTSTLNDSIVWVSPAATTIGINLIAGDGTNFIHSTVELFIDNVSQGTFSTNNIADNDALVGSANQRISYAIIVGSLSNTSHRVKLVNNTAAIMYVDYFATLDNKKPSFVIFHNINPDGGALQTGGNDAIDSMVLTLPSGLPVITVPTNTVFNPATGLDVDGVHPNNTGHKQIYNAFRAAWDAQMTAEPGTLVYDGRHFWAPGSGTMRKFLTESDAWNKADAAINAAGYVNVPYNMSYKQDGTDILKTSKTLFSTLVGPLAGISITTASGVTAMGYQAFTSATTGGANTGVGYRVGELTTTGVQNTFVGYFVGRTNNGDRNTAIGYNSFFSNASGADNTAVGVSALNANTGSLNTAVGSNALFINTSGTQNNAFGYRALAGVTTASNNNAFGSNTLRDNTGSLNTGVGTQVMFTKTGGDGNTVVGAQGFQTANGGFSHSNNTGVGYQVGGTVNTTGSNNIFLGYRAGKNLTSGSNNILLGYDINLISATTSNYLSIANLIMATGPYAVDTTVSNEAKIGIKKKAPVWGLDIHATVGITKDSAPTISSIGDNFLLTLDSSDNQVKKILPANLGFITQSVLDDTAAAIRADMGGVGGGITSINSETGPGITIAAGTGISVNTTTNTVTVSATTPNYELMFSDLSTTTVANTVTQTTLYGSGAGTAQFSSITAGSVLSLKGSGTISTDATPGVPQFSFTTGTFTLGTNLTGLTGGLTNVVYDYEYTVVPHGTGASQDIFYSLVIHVYETATTIRTYAVSASQAAGFTTTGTPAANVQVEWDTADADNSVVARKNVVEIYRK